MKPVDTHCHITDKDYNHDREKIIEDMREKLEFAVNVGYDLKTSEQSLALAEKYPFIYATAGVHPHDAKSYNTMVEERFEEMLKSPKIVAVGEIGLDYYRDLSPRDIQKDVFERQLNLAARYNKPVVIHCRDAYGDTVDILKKHSGIRGIMHSYGGSYETAREIMDRFYFSISGPVTFKNAVNVREMVAKIPIERLLIETDAPYLTPEPNRGKRNEPIFVEFVGRMVAQVKGVSYEEVCRITTENAKKVFGIVI